MPAPIKRLFQPLNPQKYKGDPTNIISRSSWEYHVMQHLDKHPDVIQWSSEEFAIPYRSPVDNRLRRYFPDFYVKMKDKNGKVKVVVIEVKPYKQTQQPPRQTTKKTARPTKQYINEIKTYGINQAKWAAARDFCADRKWEFQIMTENEIYGKKSKT